MVPRRVRIDAAFVDGGQRSCESGPVSGQALSAQSEHAFNAGFGVAFGVCREHRVVVLHLRVRAGLLRSLPCVNRLPRGLGKDGRIA